MADQPRRPRDDDDEAPRPKKGPPPAPGGGPKPKPKPKPADVDDEPDEVDDYDDAPRPKKKNKGPGGVQRIIPYKNGLALAAYYCGVFGLIPFLGFGLGPIAVVLGIMGFLKANKSSKAGGKGHAITGIILGVVDVILWPILFYTVLRPYFNQTA